MKNNINCDNFVKGNYVRDKLLRPRFKTPISVPSSFFSTMILRHMADFLFRENLNISNMARFIAGLKTEIFSQLLEICYDLFSIISLNFVRAGLNV